jgi:peptidoglycan hydrolase-like protein with peptidoglycan-binding domain
MTINNGSHGDVVASLQRSINNRLRARSASSRMVKVDGEFGPATRRAMCYAAYLLGR